MSGLHPEEKENVLKVRQHHVNGEFNRILHGPLATHNMLVENI